MLKPLCWAELENQGLNHKKFSTTYPKVLLCQCPGVNVNKKWPSKTPGFGRPLIATKPG